MAPKAPTGAAFMIRPITPNTPCATSSIIPRRALPFSPRAMSASPNRMANSSTCRMSPRAKAPTTLSGMMFSRKSTVFISCACLANWATTEASGALPPKFAPGCSRLAMTRPITNEKVDTTSK